MAEGMFMMLMSDLAAWKKGLKIWQKDEKET